MICFADLSIDEIYTVVLANARTCVYKCMWLHLTAALGCCSDVYGS